MSQENQKRKENRGTTEISGESRSLAEKIEMEK
jgi:hypothetical protein